MSKQSLRLNSLQLVFFTCITLFTGQAWSAISQQPLTLLTSADPNILINMSVETPMGGAAYNDQPDTSTGCGGRVNDGGTVGVCYSTTRRYLGYFDPDKCYDYNTNDNRKFFRPREAANADYSCSGSYFSGNFMNWATMTAFDMFTWTMTGGNRVEDTANRTVIERAQKQNNPNWFPYKLIKSSQNVAPSTVTPWSDSAIYIYNTEWGVQFATTRNLSDDDGGNRCVGADCTLNVRVKVCDETVGSLSTEDALEDNCVKYGSSGSYYYKPEGLMQANADSKRFAVTSYVGNSSRTDGGVLRAKMKYIGPTMPDGNGGTKPNPNAEFNTDGFYVTDPDGQAPTGGVVYSGVMNYLNKFSRQHGYKGLDPASELFYESLRYFRGQSNTITTGPTTDYLAQNDAERGGFPAYTTWDDPIQYTCQKNFIIGINDANPWKDKSLPGTHFTAATFSGAGISDDYGTPSNPDTFFDVKTWTNKVGDDEGLTGTSQCIGCVAGDCDIDGPGAVTNKVVPGLGEVMGTCPAEQKANSYYIAGLAYHANTTDLRPDLAGDQTVSTFMIDTQEYNANPLVGQMNMLWLAGKYGGFIDEDANGEPNLTSEWDADGDGEPDNYVLATEPTKIVSGLSRAFFDIDKRTSSASAASTNSTRTSISSKVFQARFSPIDWRGELVSRDFVNGTLSTTEVGTTIPGESAGTAATSRTIRTYNPTTRLGIDFAWSTTNLTAGQQLALNTHADGTVDGLGSDRMAYLRGDQTNEPTFRERPNSLLGDIVNSDPWYVGPVQFGYEALPGVEGTSYFTYRTSSTYLDRAPMIYVGANDGMLHGINADTMVEEFAYVPSTMFPKLSKLTNPNYAHEYFVDGAPRAGDAYFQTGSETAPSWRTVLAGTTGAGGRTVFALDVSDPTNFAADDVIWEFSSADDADLGYTISQPTIARMANGRWAVIIANGYENDGTGQAGLFILFLDADLTDGWDSGVDYVKILTGTGSLLSPNALATPIAVDFDLDRVVDYIYAGDLEGKMWKFNVTDTSDLTNWVVDFSGSPLYAAQDSGGTAQPITAKPQVGRHPDGGLIVYFGTGKYFEEGDNVVGNNPQMQTFYGIRDDLANTVSGLADLQEQTIDLEGQVNGFNARATSNNPVDWSTQDGWYMDLDSPATVGAEGERVVASPLLLNGRIIFVTLIPLPDPCLSGGTSWLMEMNAVTGGRLADAVFDLDGDGSYADEVLFDVDGNPIPISGRESTVGITKQPAIVYEEGGKENKVLSGSTGAIESVIERPGVEVGRQSWRQLR